MYEAAIAVQGIGLVQKLLVAPLSIRRLQVIACASVRSMAISFFFGTRDTRMMPRWCHRSSSLCSLSLSTVRYTYDRCFLIRCCSPRACVPQPTKCSNVWQERSAVSYIFNLIMLFLLLTNWQYTYRILSERHNIIHTSLKCCSKKACHHLIRNLVLLETLRLFFYYFDKFKEIK